MAITRDAFLYMGPKSPAEAFAQCVTCVMWTGKTCFILGPSIPVHAGDSCNLYVHGEPATYLLGKERALVTPSEAGFVRRPVRCENCAAYNRNTSRCHLFETLNKTNPQLFNLREDVDPRGCCNAQQPRS